MAASYIYYLRSHLHLLFVAAAVWLGDDVTVSALCPYCLFTVYVLYPYYVRTVSVVVAMSMG